MRWLGGMRQHWLARAVQPWHSRKRRSKQKANDPGKDKAMITALLITFAFAIGATAALECVRPLPRRNAFYV